MSAEPRVRAASAVRTGLRDATFTVWFWRCGLAVWFGLAIGFGLHRRWDFFALAVLWVGASLAGWSHGEKQLHL